MSTLKVSTADGLLYGLQHTKTIEVDRTLQGMPMTSYRRAGPPDRFSVFVGWIHE